jgi:hypothetical protein
MKIIITESQLKKMMNEVGGYDDTNIMYQHGGSLQREMATMLNELGQIITSFVHNNENFVLSKEQVITFASNASRLIGKISDRMTDLEEEIVVDDDLRTEIVRFRSTLRKLSEYLGLLSNHFRDRSTGQPVMSGIGVDMTKEEMIDGIMNKIKSSMGDIRNFTFLLRDVNQRFIDRLQKS